MRMDQSPLKDDLPTDGDTDPPEVSIVERQYQAKMDALPVKERVARAAAMFQWSREIIARQIVSQSGPMSAERLKWRVALRQYESKPITRAMIQRKLDDVPR